MCSWKLHFSSNVTPRYLIVLFLCMLCSLVLTRGSLWDLLICIAARESVIIAFVFVRNSSIATSKKTGPQIDPCGEPLVSLLAIHLSGLAMPLTILILKFLHKAPKHLRCLIRRTRPASTNCQEICDKHQWLPYFLRCKKWKKSTVFRGQSGTIFLDLAFCGPRLSSK